MSVAIPLWIATVAVPCGLFLLATLIPAPSISIVAFVMGFVSIVPLLIASVVKTVSEESDYHNNGGKGLSKVGITAICIGLLGEIPIGLLASIAAGKMMVHSL